jgi:intein/homing endonuclease
MKMTTQMNNWTESEDKFLIEYYPKMGLEFCCDKLNRSERSIKHRKSKFKLHINKSLLSKIQSENAKKRDYMNFDNFKVNPAPFINPKDPEISYILGLIWADGYVLNKGKSKTNRVSLEVLKEDGDVFQKYFQKYGEWYVTERTRNNKKPTKTIETNNRVIVEFLISKDYGVKSHKAPNKILDLIPENLHYMFFRGLSDGDGCFYISDRESHYQYSIGSSRSQDWSYVENIFKLLNISYGMSIKDKPNSKSSSIRISNKKDVIKFGNYLYENFEIDHIGLQRKYEKYKQIKSKL